MVDVQTFNDQEKRKTPKTWAVASNYLRRVLRNYYLLIVLTVIVELEPGFIRRSLWTWEMPLPDRRGHTWAMCDIINYHISATFLNKLFKCISVLNNRSVNVLRGPNQCLCLLGMLLTPTTSTDASRVSS